MRKDAPVAVIGAGIAGLTAALCLARAGFRVDILERAALLSDVGAGLQLSPNATRILLHLGLGPQLQTSWSEPEAVRLLDGRSLRMIASVPSGTFARERWQAPYAVIARAALQSVLIDAVRAEPGARLHLGVHLDAPDAASITAVTGAAPRLIVGADGVRSIVRDSLSGHGPARYSGNVAWRLTVDSVRGAPLLDARTVTAYLNRGAHLVVYPLGPSGRFNLVAIGSRIVTGDQDTAAARAGLNALFSSWHPDLRAVIAQADSLGVWPLHDVGPGVWHDGGRVLIGDAAHAMMPFAAQGAAMAIEDGFELAYDLSRSTDMTAALDGFVFRRKARIARVRSRGGFNRFAYHASGPVRLGRDLVLSLRSPQSLAADFDWLYGYRAGETG